jgi:hypothetical protein
MSASEKIVRCGRSRVSGTIGKAVEAKVRRPRLGN